MIWKQSKLEKIKKEKQTCLEHKEQEQKQELQIEQKTIEFSDQKKKPSKHVKPEVIEDFYNDKLDNQDMQRMLHHISNCEFCADMFANRFPKTDIIEAPRYLKEEIFQKAEKIPQFYKVEKKEDTKKQWLFYSLRISSVMFGALLFLISTIWNPIHFSNTDTNAYAQYVQRQEQELLKRKEKIENIDKKIQQENSEIESQIENQKPGKISAFAESLNQGLQSFSKGMIEELNQFVTKK